MILWDDLDGWEWPNMQLLGLTPHKILVGVQTTHPFSLYQRGSEAFHDPKSCTHAVHVLLAGSSTTERSVLLDKRVPIHCSAVWFRCLCLAIDECVADSAPVSPRKIGASFMLHAASSLLKASLRCCDSGKELLMAWVFNQLWLAWLVRSCSMTSASKTVGFNDNLWRLELATPQGHLI